MGEGGTEGELAIYDDVRSMRSLACLAAGLLGLGLAGVGLLVATRETYWIAWGLAVFMALLGGLLLAQLRARFARRHMPFLVVGAAGFRCPGLADPFVPWSAVERILVNDAEAVCTTFFLRADTDLPVADGSRGNVRVLRAQRAVAIAGPRPRGMTMDVFGARLEAAAAKARS